MCVFDLFPVSIHHYSNDLMFFVVVIKNDQIFFRFDYHFLVCLSLFVIIIISNLLFFKSKKHCFITFYYQHTQTNKKTNVIVCSKGDNRSLMSMMMMMMNISDAWPCIYNQIWKHRTIKTKQKNQCQPKTVVKFGYSFIRSNG